MLKYRNQDARLEVFKAVWIRVEVFWVVAPCGFAVAADVSGNLATSFFSVKWKPRRPRRRSKLLFYDCSSTRMQL